ncbi:phosphatidylglycerol lysyltransferase domain-containing protein, partial [Nocardia gipuzkoensis]
YISYAPAFGAHRGWLHDLSRRLPDAVPGVMEAVNFTAMRDFRREGARWLHFGFTPFTGLDPALELPTADRVTARSVRLLADHGERVYPARSQLEYKLKWQPTLVFPEYLAVGGRLTPGVVWSLLRMTNAL